MGRIKKSRFESLVKSFQFPQLFNELGWDQFAHEEFITVDDLTYKLTGVAEKKGYAVFKCEAHSNSILPEKSARLKIEKKISTVYHEHLLIFNDGSSQQIWQLPISEENKPRRVKEVIWYLHQDVELLYQRLRNLFFTLDEEEHITIIDVVARVSANIAANSEQITKRFYNEFTDQHNKFLKLISGIEDDVKDDENINKHWYASLMLNRLMFCYFIQKKGFLNQDTSYLRHKLEESRELIGKDNFYNFYRSFLLALFHEGLGKPKDMRHEPPEISLGRIPYLNGGLFDIHELEHRYTINISDEAFENIFDFFDTWNWYLDNRIDSDGKGINPDVIGYIFEKYINDRADMGAYYTKEDITDYISKNAIIPSILDSVQRKYSGPFDKNGDFWKFLQLSGDVYLPDSIKSCIPLTGDILSDFPEGLRTSYHNGTIDSELWLEKAPDSFSKANESYKEVLDRRLYWLNTKKKIESGDICDLDDLITLNLNIRQFVQDYLAVVEDSKFVEQFFNELKRITILDPTVGSGAFLFAALNILEPLYEVCVERIEEFTESSGSKREIISEFVQSSNGGETPNLKYLIYKTIILQNLFGVDLMKEAVEVAKLRLFLKLVAAVDVRPKEKNYGLEPLPDIDFNIVSGNTLIGFADEKELTSTISKIEGMFSSEALARFRKELVLVSDAYERFRVSQISYEPTTEAYRSAKSILSEHLKKLNEKLDHYLATNNGVIIEKDPEGYESWIKSHQPFHWLTQFYHIMSIRGGFDVVIGNPPYIRMSKVDYIFDKGGIESSDIYGHIINRVYSLINERARFGFIVMHNLAFSRGFSEVRNLIRTNSSKAWFSFYARIPAGLFSGDVRVRNCIFISDCDKSKAKGYFTSRMHRWFAADRDILFQNLRYTQFDFKSDIPRYPDKTLKKFFSVSTNPTIFTYTSRSRSHLLYFKQSAYNWLTVTPTPPPCYNSKGEEIAQTQVSELRFESERSQLFAMLFLNGRVNYSRWLCYGDEFHVTKEDLMGASMPCSSVSISDQNKLLELASKYIQELPSTIQYKLNAGKKVGSYNTARLWSITEKSDEIFLKYMTNNPQKVLDSIDLHLMKTIMSET